jgi:DNA-binding MarR family transcriptional regulator
VRIKIPHALDTKMKRRAGFSHFEYLVLSVISETEDRVLPMSELAKPANSSLSRLSHVVSRLEKRGWVVRTPCPGDGRITICCAILTHLVPDGEWPPRNDEA